MSPAAGQEQLWLNHFGSSATDAATALATDNVGNIFVSGFTEGNLAGRLGGGDAFLTRYDIDGNQLWARQFGTSAWESASALTTDGAGGTLVAGGTDGDLAGSQLGEGDAYIARYDGTGNQLWIRQFGTAGLDGAMAMVSDGVGGAMVGGQIEGTYTFIWNYGYILVRIDPFVARYDGDGNQLWLRQIGTEGLDNISAMTTDGAGGIIATGITTGSLGGPGAGGYDVFLTRYDADGNQLWMHQFGTDENDMAHGIASDGVGGAMVVGYTAGSLGGPYAGRHDAFVARFDGAGNQLWVRQFGTELQDGAYAAAADGAGGVLVAGSTRGDLGGPSVGYLDNFLTRYDSAGNRIWMRQFGTSLVDQPTSLANDGAGSVMIAGTSGPGVGVGPYDAFIGRYTIDSCYADCDRTTGNGVLDIFDFLCFQNDFVTGNSQACDCDTSTGLLVCDIFDFLCFQNAFATGCS